MALIFPRVPVIFTLSSFEYSPRRWKSTKIGRYMSIWNANKFATFHAKRLSRSDLVKIVQKVCFFLGGGYFFETPCTVDSFYPHISTNFCRFILVLCNKNHRNMFTQASHINTTTKNKTFFCTTCSYLMLI